ncbi:MAG: hypothetical protein JXR30_03340 [Alphaproteobacteria bacterium]|nr:hypothetical protein [Alphaproteobacteria bacterium]
MREPIYKAVASPPTFLWAPLQLAILNLVFNFAIMAIVMGVTLGSVNPLIFTASITFFHLMLIYMHRKDPHMATILRNMGFVRKKTIRLDSGDGNKFSA